ncbi:hypothetical protein [Streptomyces sp. NPDC058475]|uniref:hypothetical protein n=1 Tax=unclassified Streptomyces TaxID=2593676 RepID=UPI0036540121
MRGQELVREQQLARGQELVFIGTGLRRESLRLALARCLLTEDELSTRSAYDDPFPEWAVHSTGSRATEG